LHRGTTLMQETRSDHHNTHVVPLGSLGRNCGSTCGLDKRLVGSQMHGGDPVHKHASDVCYGDGVFDATWLSVAFNPLERQED
jgi:hypothetical protein